LQFLTPTVFLACGVSLAAADYATYIGDAFAYTVTAMPVDASGNTYLTWSRAVVVPVAGTYDDILTDIFVM
jgi:hypothetical protein